MKEQTVESTWWQGQESTCIKKWLTFKENHNVHLREQEIERIVAEWELGVRKGYCEVLTTLGINSLFYIVVLIQFSAIPGIFQQT